MILTVGIRHPAPGDILENWPGANRSARSGVTGTDSVRDTSSRPSRDAPGITPGAFFVAGRPPVGYRHRFRMGNGAMPKRRGRGEGGVEQLPSGRWRAVVVLKTDPATGRRDRISKTFAAKADALDWLRDNQTEKSLGRLVASSKMTVADWSAKWLSLKALSVEPATHRWYKTFLDRFILPHLGKERISGVAPESVIDLYERVRKDGANASQLSKVGLTIRAMMATAVKSGLLGSNPAGRVPRPKSPHREMQAWNALECRQFLAVSDTLETPFPAYFRFLLDSGCRPGEAIGLKWDDYDASTGLVRIVRSVEDQGKAVAVREKDTKTKKGRRVVLLSPSTRAALADLPKTSHLVFPGPSGGWLRINFASKTFKAAVAAAGVRKIRQYDLRHTSATLLLQAGVNIKVIADRLGHEDPALTLRVYAHALPVMQELAAQAAESLWGSPHALPTPVAKLA